MWSVMSGSHLLKQQSYRRRRRRRRHHHHHHHQNANNSIKTRIVCWKEFDVRDR
jgi:U3 small nucleolar ribonucleoprotein component